MPRKGTGADNARHTPDHEASAAQGLNVLRNSSGADPLRRWMRILRALQLSALALALVSAAGWWVALNRPGTSLDELPAFVSGLVDTLIGRATDQQGLPGSMVETQPERRVAAPDLQLTLFDGGTLRLTTLHSSVVVVNFWASWCVPCRNEAPALERVWVSDRDRGATFVGVDIQDTDPAAQAFIQEFGITYPNGPDNTTRIATDYRVTGIPVTLVVDRAGRFARRWVGELNEQQLAAIVEEELVR